MLNGFGAESFLPAIFLMNHFFSARMVLRVGLPITKTENEPLGPEDQEVHSILLYFPALPAETAV